MNRVRVLNKKKCMIVYHSSFSLVIWLLLLFAMATSLYGFTMEQLEEMRSHPLWIVGKGEGETSDQADRKAIRDFLHQITLEVRASFKNTVVEVDGDVDRYTESVIETYSSGNLTYATRSTFEPQDGPCIVYRYMKKSMKDSLFAGRELMIGDYVQRGIEAEKELRIGSALMNYYWSLLLLRTHPEVGAMTKDMDDGKSVVLITWLPARINRILDMLSISIGNLRRDEKKDCILATVTAIYGGQPVRNLDFQYYHGNDWSRTTGMRDGSALIEFHCSEKEIPDPISIQVMYTYASRASVCNTVKMIFDDPEMVLPTFPKNRFEISLNHRTIATAENAEPVVTVLSDSVDIHRYQELTARLCQAIQNRNPSSVRAMCTPEAMQDYRQLIEEGQARMVHAQPRLRIDRAKGKTVVRGMMMQFSYPKSGKSFTEPLVFSFNEKNLIEKIAFGLTEKATEDIIGTVDITPEEKHQILAFIEDYKTAYVTGNLDFLEKVFADNALIIVGKMLRDDEETDLEVMYTRLGERWRPVQYDKKDYIQHLQNVFRSNEFVNLTFEDNRLQRKNGEDGVFGLQIHQYWHSQNYADEGYLFLMFNLSDPNQPKIHVRTWQPEKNPDGSIFGLTNFFMEN